MTRKKTVSYGVLLAAGVLGSIGVRLWLDSLDFDGKYRNLPHVAVVDEV